MTSVYRSVVLCSKNLNPQNKFLATPLHLFRIWPALRCLRKRCIFSRGGLLYAVAQKTGHWPMWMKNIPLFNFVGCWPNLKKVFVRKVPIKIPPHLINASLRYLVKYGSFADCGKWPVFAQSSTISMHCLILLDFLSSVGALLLLLFFAGVYWTRYVF